MMVVVEVLLGNGFRFLMEFGILSFDIGSITVSYIRLEPSASLNIK